MLRKFFVIASLYVILFSSTQYHANASMKDNHLFRVIVIENEQHKTEWSYENPNKYTVTIGNEIVTGSEAALKVNTLYEKLKVDEHT